MNTHATYNTEPGFVASLLNPVDLLSGAIAGKVVGRTAIAAFDAIAPKAARSAAKGVGPVKTAATWIKRAALRLVSRGAEEGEAKIVKQLTKEEFAKQWNKLEKLVPKNFKAEGWNLQRWGALIWGEGSTGARDLMYKRTATQLEEIGLTVKNAGKLRDFFQAAGVLPERVDLLNNIIETLQGKLPPARLLR